MTAVTGTRPGVPPAAPGYLPSPVLVGRRKELGWLGAALARVRSGSPSALLIGGDAGVGKTRLVAEFGAAAGPAARVLTGRCPELGTVGVPFAPFVAVVRELVRDRALAELIGSAGHELLRWLPDLGAPAAAGSAREARARLFVEMLSLLEQLARQRPVVLVIEDAHWADESTRDLMSFLIDSQQAMDGVLVIVTYRSDELHRGHPLRSLLTRLGRLGWVQRTELSGLSRRESAELVGCLLGSEPAPSLADGVYRRADGNPLFTEELVCCDGPRGAASTAAPGDLMLAAIRRLPEQTQDLLRTASAGGQRTARRLLAAVTGMSAAALDAGLRPALAGGVLIADAESCAFRHALISEAIHQDLLPCEHTAAHLSFAAALEEDPFLVPAGFAAIEQAEHLHHARDPVRSLTSAWRAAADAGRALAYAEQLAMLTRVLGLWPCVPEAERLTGSAHANVLRQAAEVADATGERQLAAALAAAARDGADARQVSLSVRAAGEIC
jgi:predicted ATPase